MSRRKKHFIPKDRQSRARLLPPEEGRPEGDCGLCRLCEIIDAPIERAPIRCGVAEIPREDDRGRVGLGDLNPERGLSDGCLWRRGIWDGGRETRPDRTGVVPCQLKPPFRPNDIGLFIDRKKPTSYRRSQTRKLIARFLKAGRRVFIDDGSGIRKVALLEVSQ